VLQDVTWVADDNPLTYPPYTPNQALQEVTKWLAENGIKIANTQSFSVEYVHRPTSSVYDPDLVFTFGKIKIGFNPVDGTVYSIMLPKPVGKIPQLKKGSAKVIKKSVRNP